MRIQPTRAVETAVDLLVVDVLQKAWASPFRPIQYLLTLRQKASSLLQVMGLSSHGIWCFVFPEDAVILEIREAVVLVECVCLECDRLYWNRDVTQNRRLPDIQSSG